MVAGPGIRPKTTNHECKRTNTSKRETAGSLVPPAVVFGPVPFDLSGQLYAAPSGA